MRLLNLESGLRRFIVVGAVPTAITCLVWGAAAWAAASSFHIKKLSPDPMTTVLNGPKKSLTIDWTGRATFPITAYVVPQHGCSTAGFTCEGGSHKFATPSHTLVWKNASSCGGSLARSHTGKWSVYLVNAERKRTPKKTWTVTCKVPR